MNTPIETGFNDASARQAGGDCASSALADELDVSLLDGLCTDYGTELFDEIAQALPEDIADCFAALDACLNASDRSGAEAALHALKGTALTVGLRGFAARCADHEASTRAGEPLDAEMRVALQAHWKRAYAALEGWRSDFRSA